MASQQLTNEMESAQETSNTGIHMKKFHYHYWERSI